MSTAHNLKLYALGHEKNQSGTVQSAFAVWTGSNNHTATVGLFARLRMDLGNVTARERDHGCLAPVYRVRFYNDGSASSFCLGHSIGKIGDLVAG